METQKSKTAYKPKKNKVLIKKRVLADGSIEITRYAFPWEYKYCDHENIYDEERQDYKEVKKDY